MKKIYNIATMFAVLILGVMTACTPDENDWTVDESVKRQLAPASLEGEIDDYSLDLKVTIGRVSRAESYELQVSEKQLVSGYDETEGIPTFTIVPDEGSTGDIEYTVSRNDEKLEEPITQNQTYYIRVRAIDANGGKSKWYTNGMNYTDGLVADPVVALSLEENATLKVTARAGMDADYGDKFVNLTWYFTPDDVDKTYCAAPTYIINETLKDAGEAESVYKHTLTSAELTACEYSWEGLEENNDYSFTLYDEEGMVIGDVQGTTEYTPDMSLARSILTWTKADVIGKIGEKKTLVDPDKGDFQVILNEDNAANDGYNTTTYWCQTPDRKAYASSGRFSSKNRNSMTIKVPGDGRFYIYGNGKPTTYQVAKFVGVDEETQEEKWENIQQVTVKANAKVSIYAESEGKNKDCFKFTRMKLAGGKDNTYKITPTASASCYIYGFVFVPDSEQ